ncbi:MAG: hypothetical protein OHK0026_00480 [Rhodocyclaceae bacterium]
MTEPLWQQADSPRDALGRALFRASRAFALAGGLLLVAVSAMSVASIASRWLGAGPLLGDFELVQLACAVSVSAFLPWCQMLRGHVLVDFFTNGLGRRARAVLDAIGNAALAAVAALLAWRIALGMIGIRQAAESTMLLGVPIWYAYALMLPSFALLSLAAAHTAARELGRALR